MSAGLSAPGTARQRVRAELSREILGAARRRLASDGPAQLSLRAVARDLGMAPSAIYRYYQSRDALLTALIIGAYEDLGRRAHSADADVDPTDVVARWMETTRAIRHWGLTHPQEWALIYGSPVPGYRAPDETVAAASLVTEALGLIVSDAFRLGKLVPPLPVVVAEGLVGDLDRVRDLVGELPNDAAVLAVLAWGYVLGAVSLELFGHYDGGIDARDVLWETVMTTVATVIGLT